MFDPTLHRAVAIARIAAVVLVTLAPGNGLGAPGEARERPGPAPVADRGPRDAAAPGSSPAAATAPEQLRAVLLPVSAITGERLAHDRTHHLNAVVVDLAEVDDPDFGPALDRIRGAGFEIHYWIEVGRDQEAARDHPDWLHRPHKSAFYGEPVVIDGWVSINNRDVFHHELERIVGLARRAGVEGVSGIFLNDVLGAPEGCGCGNALCRLWDNSLGDKVSGGSTVMSFGENPVAPRLLAAAVARELGGIEAIPVITEECEAGIEIAGVEDPEMTLGYGRMSCRNPCADFSYRRLVETLSDLPRVGMLALYRTFGRDVPEYGPEAAWIGGIVERYHGLDRQQSIITVLEGWDVTPEQVEAQIAQALAGGAAGFVIATAPIDQTWRVKPLEARGKKI